MIMIGIFCMDLINISFPLLRQIFGFIYLTLLPGMLIVRLLNLRNSNLHELFLYNIGFSLLCIMLSGYVVNEIFSTFIQKPVSTYSILFALFFLTIILSSICLIHEKKSYEPSKYKIDYKLLLNRKYINSCLLLLFVFLITLVGTHFVNHYGTNTILLVMLILVLIIFVLITFNIYIPQHIYGATILFIAISLLYHNSLIFDYIYGWDTHQEFYFSNLVITDGYWNNNLEASVNSVFSIVFLIPVYSLICNLTVTQVIKIVLPILFALLPYGLYHIYRKQALDNKIAFIGVFYFISINRFYTELLALGRQQIGELFVMLILLTIVSDEKLLKKKILIIIFSLGLIVSHYALSHLFFIYLLIGYIVGQYLFKWTNNLLNQSYVLLFGVILISWYMVITQGSIFETVIHLFTRVFSTFLSDFGQTTATEVISGQSFFITSTLLRLSYLFSQLCIVIGFLGVLTKFKNYNFSKDFMLISTSCLLIIVLPLFTSSTGMNIHRLYHISSIALSVFLIPGTLVLFSGFKTIMSSRKFQLTDKKYTMMLGLVACLFFLLNIGFVQEIIDENPTSISLSQESLMVNKYDENALSKLNNSKSFHRVYISEYDVYGSKWLSKHRNNDFQIYADMASIYFIFTSYGMMPSNESIAGPISLTNSNMKAISDSTEFQPTSYIYLRYFNSWYGSTFDPNNKMKEIVEIKNIGSSLKTSHVVYNSGKNIIYNI